MKPLAEIAKNYADARHLEMTTGLDTTDAHRVFIVNDADELQEIAKAADAYDAIQAAMMRIAVNKVRNIAHARAVLMETHATARRKPDDLAIDEATFTPDMAADWPSASVVMAVACDGDRFATSTRTVTSTDDLTDQPDCDEDNDVTEVGGKLAEALTTLAIGTLMAAMIAKKGDDN